MRKRISGTVSVVFSSVILLIKVYQQDSDTPFGPVVSLQVISNKIFHINKLLLCYP